MFKKELKGRLMKRKYIIYSAVVYLTTQVYTLNAMEWIKQFFTRSKPVPLSVTDQQKAYESYLEQLPEPFNKIYDNTDQHRLKIFSSRIEFLKSLAANDLKGKDSEIAESLQAIAQLSHRNEIRQSDGFQQLK